MSEHDVKPHTEFTLPPNIVSQLDMRRLVREAERIDNELTEAALREKSGGEWGVNSSYSEQLSTLLEYNQLSFDDPDRRSQIIHRLRELRDAMPVLHFTFSSPADRESLEGLVQWVRDSVHPQAVIEDGVQPALVAGVYLRTTNRVHDLSLRETLRQNRHLLAKELEAIRGR